MIPVGATDEVILCVRGGRNPQLQQFQIQGAEGNDTSSFVVGNPRLDPTLVLPVLMEDNLPRLAGPAHTGAWG